MPYWSQAVAVIATRRPSIWIDSSTTTTIGGLSGSSTASREARSNHANTGDSTDSAIIQARSSPSAVRSPSAAVALERAITDEADKITSAAASTISVTSCGA